MCRRRYTIFSKRERRIQSCYLILTDLDIFFCTATLGPWIYIKLQRPGRGRAEVDGLRFVKSHTTIPVPHVWMRVPAARIFRVDYIIMWRLRGTPLNVVWPSYSIEKRKQIANQLANYFTQLRSLESPFGSRICSANGGPIHDNRLTPTCRGPFADEAAMNRALRRETDLDIWPQSVVVSHSSSHPIVFTHGDLTPRNVMVEDGRVTALIDWETSGWFPAHWEYRKALWARNYPFGTSESWYTYIPTIIPVYEDEIRADALLASRCWYPSL